MLANLSSCSLIILIATLLACAPHNSANQKYDYILQAKLHHEAQLALLNRAWQEAEAIYNLSYQLFPNPIALDGLGVVAFRQSSFMKAESLFLQASELFPDYPSALLNLAYLYEFINKKHEARDIYRKLLAVAPNNYRLHNNFAAYLFDNHPAKNQEICRQLWQAQAITKDQIISKNIAKLKKLAFC